VGLGPLILPDTGDWSIAVDLAVVGAGGCGLAGAVAAARGGAEVFVFERSEAPLPNTAQSQGMVPGAGSRFQREAGVDDGPERFLDDLLRKTRGTADPALARLMAETSGPLVEWLADEVGVELGFVTGFTYPGHSACRMHAPPGRTGHELMRDLRRAAAREGAEVVLGAGVEGLIAGPDGAVRGLLVRQGGAVERVRAGAVLLASNGFAGNPAMVREHCPEVADALYLGGEGSTGEAIRWGTALGGRTAYMDAYQGHATVATPHNALVTYAVVTEGGVLLNRHGQRFGDESSGYSEFAVRVLAQPDGLAWAVYDERIHRLALDFTDYRDAVAAGAVRSGATVVELARMLGIDPDGAEATLAAYAEAAAGGRRDEHGRAARFLEGPFHGVRVTGALFHTQGGLVVDELARVVGSDGTPVPGLHAGGGVAAGISGHGAGGYMSGNGLLTALALGWIAGRHVAATTHPEPVAATP
jgi:fumarate reductase flavoprotein subunit